MVELKLFINKKEWPFITANLVFSIEQLAHTFSFTILDKEIQQPEPVEVYLNDRLILVGQIDSCSQTTGKEIKTQTISGRSISANLIDSRIKMDAVYNQKFDQLLNSVASGFSMQVKNNVAGSLPLIPEFQINAESPLQNLAQIAKQQGLMIYEKNATLYIEKPGQFVANNLLLEDGENLQNITIQHNWSQLFSRYEVQGAWDNSNATVTQAGVNSSRQKVIISDKLQNQESCQARAEYERDLANAQSLTVSGTVPGIHTALDVHALNKLIHVISKEDQLDEHLLIKSLTLSVTGSQHQTGIQLMRPFSQGVQHA